MASAAARDELNGVYRDDFIFACKVNAALRWKGFRVMDQADQPIENHEEYKAALDGRCDKPTSCETKELRMALARELHDLGYKCTIAPGRLLNTTTVSGGALFVVGNYFAMVAITSVVPPLAVGLLGLGVAIGGVKCLYDLYKKESDSAELSDDYSAAGASPLAADSAGTPLLGRPSARAGSLFSPTLSKVGSALPGVGLIALGAYFAVAAIASVAAPVVVGFVGLAVAMVGAKWLYDHYKERRSAAREGGLWQPREDGGPAARPRRAQEGATAGSMAEGLPQGGGGGGFQYS